MKNTAGVSIEDSSPEISRRRKRILIRNNILSMIGYLIPLVFSWIADLLNLTSLPAWFPLFVILLYGTLLLFLFVIIINKNITARFGNVIGFLQLLNWTIFFTCWVSMLNKARVIALFMAFIALIYLISFGSAVASSVISAAAILSFLAGSFAANVAFGSDGTLTRDILYAFSFVPAAFFISYLSAASASQREALKAAKRESERARDALWKEMALAKEIQARLLPQVPEIPGYEISVVLRPSVEVGGDYYDIVHAGGREWIFIGDVSGHGVSAGLVMMMVQASLQVILAQKSDCSPAELLDILNEVYMQNIRRVAGDKYMTLSVIACHQEGRFTFSGLHQDILIYRAKTGRVEVIETNGMWMGVMDTVREVNRNDTFELEPGDTLLLYTDGLTEATKADGEMFSSDRVVEILGSCGRGSAAEVKARLLDELDNYTQNDDYTIFVLKRKSESNIREDND